MPGYVPEPDGDVFGAADESFAALKGWLESEEAAGADHAELERQVSVRGRELQRQLLQAHLDLREAREKRVAAVTGPDEVTRTRAEKGHARTLASVFGPVTVTRIAYRAAGAPNVHPLDEQLGLPPQKYSGGLCEKLVLAAARTSLAGSCDAVFGETGVRIGTRQAAEIIDRAAADFGSFYACRCRSAVLGDGDVLVLQCDGKGIRMRPDSLRPAAAAIAAKSAPKQHERLSRGEVSTRKRIAEAGSVYTITPVPRTASDILGPPPGQDPPASTPPDGPRARDKWVTASIDRNAAAVIADIFAEADRRDPGHTATWIALADGNKDQIARIRAEAAARGITVTVIIDIIHVSEYLWRAAWCFHPEASPGAGPWVLEQLHAIAAGRAHEVAAAITARAAATPLSKTKAATAARTARYLQNKAPYLDYATALAAGWPIATGVIEGACRHLIKDRMDITGARWSTPGAEAILQLRAIITNGHWDQYQAWHNLQQHHRTYRGTRTCWQLAA
jgi:hypothetical protein